ncbi:MAG: LacI family DNA-binding transcriptional regulator [Alkalispirochaeta sp.]
MGAGYTINDTMGARVRIADIADRADVSSATVSRVLNDPQRVTSRTRERIYAAMRELNYMPPTVRRDPDSLSHIIGIFAPHLMLDSVTELVRAVEEELADTSFDILLVNMRGNRDFGSFIQGNSPILRKIDGAVVFSADVSQQAVDFMKSADIPVVLLQSRSQLVRAVSNNNFLGGQDAAAHLLDCGYRRVAFVGWEPLDEHVSDRLDGFRSALTREDEALSDADTYFGPLSVEGGYRATHQLLRTGTPDAIFYASDVLAMGGMRRLREAALQIPEDIGIMGFDDLRVAAPLGLTTMRQFFSTKAQMVIEYLLGRISGEIRTDQPEELQVSPKLVVRDTTRPRTGEQRVE